MNKQWLYLLPFIFISMNAMVKNAFIIQRDLLENYINNGKIQEFGNCLWEHQHNLSQENINALKDLAWAKHHTLDSLLTLDYDNQTWDELFSTVHTLEQHVEKEYNQRPNDFAIFDKPFYAYSSVIDQLSSPKISNTTATILNTIKNILPFNDNGYNMLMNVVKRTKSKVDSYCTPLLGIIKRPTILADLCAQFRKQHLECETHNVLLMRSMLELYCAKKTAFSNVWQNLDC